MIALVADALQKLGMTEADLGAAFIDGFLFGVKPEDVVAELLLEAGLAERAIELEEKKHGGE